MTEMIGPRATEIRKVVAAAQAAGLRARRGKSGYRNCAVIIAPDGGMMSRIRVAIHPKVRGAYDVRFHVEGSKVAEPETAIRLVLRNYPYRIEG